MSRGSQAHLVRRSLRWMADSILPSSDDRAQTASLSPTELELWRRMQRQDRAHALRVLRRHLALRPGASEEERKGVLLHDVGKTVSRLGFVSRVAATVLGPRTTRWRSYLDHERIGADLLRSAGSSDEACELVEGSGDPSATAAFRVADDE